MYLVTLGREFPARSHKELSQNQVKNENTQEDF